MTEQPKRPLAPYDRYLKLQAALTSYPLDRWYVRLIVHLDWARRRLVRNAFCTSVHAVSEMERFLNEGWLQLE